MLKRNPRVELLRKRSAAHKVTVSELARENHVIQVNLNISKMLLGQTALTKTEALHSINKSFFSCCKQFGIDNACFITKKS